MICRTRTSIVTLAFLVAVAAHTDEACVRSPDGAIVCGESVAKQPAPHQSDRQTDAETEDEHKSGYTHAQLDWDGFDRETKMTYRQLGKTGLRVSSLSLGSWVTFSFQVGEERAIELMYAAFDAGINFFDNAEAYASGEAETIMGKAISAGVASGKWRRSDLVISTKVYWGKREGGAIKSVNDVGLSRKHVLEGVDASLKRLGLQYADIVFAHRPDQHTPIEETVRAFNHLINTGRILYWGTSEWPAQDIAKAWAVADRLGLVGPQAEQPSYSMLMRSRMEREYAPFYASERGLGTTVYSPLASGVLTGKYNDGIPAGSRFTVKQYEYLRKGFLGGTREEAGRLGGWEAVVSQVKAMAKIAEAIGATPAQLAIAWCLVNPNVSTVILGASKVEQLEENIGALAVARRLSPSVMQQIEAVFQNAPSAAEKDWVAASLNQYF